MSFQLFGFDFIPSDNLYGIWAIEFKCWRDDRIRNLFSVYYADGEWLIDLMFIRII